MKKLLSIILFLISLNCYSFTKVPIPVIGITETEFEMMFNLETGLTPLKVILDCQSFFHGLNVYEKKNNGTFEKALGFYLYEPECREIYGYIKTRSDQNLNSCIILDTENKNYQLLSSCGKD